MPASTTKPRTGPLRSMSLYALAPRRWDREELPGFGVDLVAMGGDGQAIITVFGTTADETAQRAKDVLHALALRRLA